MCQTGDVADPLVVVVGGPNGAGKSTTAPRLLRGALAVREFVNADAIAQGLSAFQPETVAFAAGRVMLARLRALAAARDSFAFETTLTSRNFAPWLEVVRRRFVTGLSNFFSLFMPVADSWQMFDNSGIGGPRLIAGPKPGASRVVYDDAVWRRLEEVGR